MRSRPLKQSVLTVSLALCTLAMTATSALAQSPVERGRHLVNGIGACGNCHTPFTAEGKPDMARAFSGGRPFREPQFTSYAANITPDPDTGLGKWTDDQIARAIREGVRPDGSIIGDPMPIALYRELADEDLRAIVAYLKSVPPVRNAVQKSQYKTPPASYGPPVQSVAMPPRDDLVKYGAYLAGPLGHCTECHTLRDANRHPDYKNKLGSGGNQFHGPWGTSVSRNLTPHATGLRDWTDAEIDRAIRTGVDRAGNKLKPPMGFGYYANIDTHEMRALIAWMRSLKPLPMGGG